MKIFGAPTAPPPGKPAPKIADSMDYVDTRQLTPSTEVLQPPEHQSFWLWVMCLTGVDYFSTLGYQPSIAFEAVGLLAPIATIVLIAVTLGCALPVYCRVAEESPLGHGSISMLERLLHGWTAKFLVLVLLGFAATDFIITQTLSAADAAEHLIHNPFWASAPPILQSQMLLTIGMLLAVGRDVLARFQRSHHDRGRDRGILFGAERDRAAERHCLSRGSSVAGVGLVSRGAARRLAHGARRQRQRAVGRGADLLDFLSKTRAGIERF